MLPHVARSRRGFWCQKNRLGFYPDGTSFFEVKNDFDFVMVDFYPKGFMKHSARLLERVD